MPELTAGVVPALITPLTPSGDIDHAGCRRLVDHVIAAGVHGVLALGSTGEAAALGPRRRAGALESLAAAVAGRVPFAVGIAEPSLPAAQDEVVHAAEAGASAVVVTPPYYAPIGQDVVVRFYEDIAKSSPVPVLAYNIPAFTKVRIDPATLGRLTRDGVIAGVKDSSADLEYLQQVLLEVRERRDVFVFTGMDTFSLAALALGADGVIAVSSNLAPRLSIDLYAAVRAGRLDEAVRLQRGLLELVLALRAAGPLPTGIKAALRLRDICGDTTAAPLISLPADRVERLASELDRLGILPTDERARTL